MDCQTTGMQPSVGNLLEIAWGVGSANQSEPLKIESRLIQIPGDEGVPFKIQAITGIKNSDMESAISLEEVYLALKKIISGEAAGLTAAIHYAQFERPFLLDLFQRFEPAAALPFEIICSAQISRRLFPAIPSRNIRAIAGYFGATVGELKRASSHVAATFEIWKELILKLAADGITEADQLKVWLQEKPPSKKKISEKIKYDYRIDKEMRLALPDRPGIYRMLSKSGDVLYVGKATSLKSRVNSYFRGQKNRDRKKLEMLSQVWDIRVTECGSALEAALMETDEIKKLDPPYNISLKGQRHPPVFYAKDFSKMGVEQNQSFQLGPFRGSGPIEHLRILRQLLAAQKPVQVFYVEIEDEVLASGFELFCRQYDLSLENFFDLRKTLAFGLRHFRQHLRDSKLTEEVAEEQILESEGSEIAPEIEEVLTPEDIAGKFFRLLLRAAAEYRRSRILTRLLNSKVSWQTKEGWSFLEIHQGQITPVETQGRERNPWPWTRLDLRDYDRMSVLLSELSKHPHKIESRRSAL